MKEEEKLVVCEICARVAMHSTSTAECSSVRVCVCALTGAPNSRLRWR